MFVCVFVCVRVSNVRLYEGDKAVPSVDNISFHACIFKLDTVTKFI